jgi:hypothetical protein
MTVVDSAESGRRLRCALFVDFDNVYIGLQRLDPGAAEAFASAPTHWLTALETGNDVEGEFSRRPEEEPAEHHRQRGRRLSHAQPQNQPLKPDVPTSSSPSVDRG